MWNDQIRRDWPLGMPQSNDVLCAFSKHPSQWIVYENIIEEIFIEEHNRPFTEFFADFRYYDFRKNHSMTIILIVIWIYLSIEIET